MFGNYGTIACDKLATGQVLELEEHDYMNTVPARIIA